MEIADFHHKIKPLLIKLNVRLQPTQFNYTIIVPGLGLWGQIPIMVCVGALSYL